MMKQCYFYQKIGACKHSTKCQKPHARPSTSPTILIPNLYFYPKHDPLSTLSAEALQEHINLFYEDIFTEIGLKYGRIRDMLISINVSDHLLGNVYVKFSTTQEARRCLDGLSVRYYCGRKMSPELSPVVDFEEACCKDSDECLRGGFCNYIHRGRIDEELVKELYESQEMYYRL